MGRACGKVEIPATLDGEGIEDLDLVGGSGRPGAVETEVDNDSRISTIR